MNYELSSANVCHVYYHIISIYIYPVLPSSSSMGLRNMGTNCPDEIKVNSTYQTQYLNISNILSWWLLHILHADPLSISEDSFASLQRVTCQDLSGPSEQNTAYETCVQLCCRCSFSWEILAFFHKCEYIYIIIYIYIYIAVYIVYIACMHACMHTYIHTYIHTHIYIDTHIICIYIYIYISATIHISAKHCS